MIRIWQVNKDKFYDYAFFGYDDVIRHHGEGSVTIDNYDKVYEFEMQSSSEWRLDDLFEIFNTNRPSDFHGHSMSVSDVVEVDGVFWYCDDIGWKKLDWEVSE